MKVDLKELIEAGILDKDTAESIHHYYNKKRNDGPNKTIIAFGIIGALLIGLGIILILAHNWDQFSRTIRTILAFMPLIVSQVLVLFTIITKRHSEVWRESASILLFFAVGTCIALISQIYNLPGSISEFTLTWMLLTVPLVYIVPSRIISLFYIIGITYYACEIGYWNHPTSENALYFLLILVIMPFYIRLSKETPRSNSTIFHHWLIPISLTIVLGILARDFDEALVMTYFALFGLFLAVSKEAIFKAEQPYLNGYSITGTLGTIILLLSLSFNAFWRSLRDNNEICGSSFLEIEFLVAVGLATTAALLFYRRLKHKGENGFNLLEVIYLVMFPVFLLGWFTSWGMSIVNILILAIGISIIRSAAKSEHLGRLNFGLFIITALIICRFFDTDLSFILRGVLFVLMGLAFFLTNIWIINKRKANE